MRVPRLCHSDRPTAIFTGMKIRCTMTERDQLLATAWDELDKSVVLYRGEPVGTVAARDPAKIPGRFYVRLSVADRPGVLAQIAGKLGRHGISIASVIQHEPELDGEGGTVPLVIMTHIATEGSSRAAIEVLDSSMTTGAVLCTAGKNNAAMITSSIPILIIIKTFWVFELILKPIRFTP